MDASPELPPGDHIWLPVAIPFGEWAAGLPEHCLKLVKQNKKALKALNTRMTLTTRPHRVWIPLSWQAK